MSNLPDYYYITVEARAVIGGRAVPVSSFACDFALDEMSIATIDIPLGRLAGGGAIGTDAPVENVLTNLRPNIPVDLFAKFTPKPGSRAAPPGAGPGFPVGQEFLCFTGYTRGPAFSKDFESRSAVFCIEVYGWAVGLAGATQFVNGTVVTSAPNGGSLIQCRLGDTPKVAPTLVDVLVQNFGGAAANLWGTGIYPLFQEIINNVSAWSEQENSFAEDALAKFTGSPSLPEIPLSLARYPVATGSSAKLFERSLATWLVNCIYNGWVQGGADLWDTLLYLAGTFMFRVVTAIESGVVAPITLALGGSPYKTINPNEYFAVSERRKFDPKYYAYPSSCGIYATGWQSSPWQDKSAVTAAYGRAHLDISALSGTGRFLLRAAPAWLVPVSASATDSIAPGGPIPDASNPTGGAAPKVSQGEAESKYFSDTDDPSATPGNGVAMSILRDELFFARQMSLTGRFRVDIAPGSLLCINTMGEVFAGLGQTLFAHVTSVRLEVGVSGSNGYARTSFGLTAVRSKVEHDNSELTTPVHPLFGERWVGGPLAKEMA